MKKTFVIIILICIIAYFTISKKVVEDDVVNIEPQIEKIKTELKETVIEITNYEIITPSKIEEAEEIPENYHFSLSNHFISTEDQKNIDDNKYVLNKREAIVTRTGVILDDNVLTLFDHIEKGSILTGSTIDVFGNMMTFDNCIGKQNGGEIETSEGTNKEGQRENTIRRIVVCDTEFFSFNLFINIHYLTKNEIIDSEKSFKLGSLLVDKELENINLDTKKVSQKTTGFFRENSLNGYLMNEN